MVFFFYCRPHSCPDCGKSYKDAASYKRHRLVHANGSDAGSDVSALGRMQSCPLCPETFPDAALARRHILLAHPNAEPHEAKEEDEGELDDDENKVQ